MTESPGPGESRGDFRVDTRKYGGAQTPIFGHRCLTIPQKFERGRPPRSNRFPLLKLVRKLVKMKPN